MKNACINAYLVDTWIGMICDMGETPYLMVYVDNTNRDIRVPSQFIREDHTIVLNVAPSAVSDFHIDKENGIVTFNARFQGKSEHIIVPCEAIQIIQSREGQFATMVSGDLSFYHPDEPSVVAYNEPESQPEPVRPVSGGGDTMGPRPDAPKTSEPGKRAHLRVVK